MKPQTFKPTPKETAEDLANSKIKQHYTTEDKREVARKEHTNGSTPRSTQ